MTRLGTPPSGIAGGRSHTVVTALGLLGAAGAMALGGGPVGLVAGGVFLLVGVAVPPLLAFAIGEALLVGGLGAAPLAWIVVAQAGLALVLAGELATRPTGDAAAALFVALGIPLVGLAVGLVLVTSLLTGTLLVGGAIALLAYLVHRYELLRLGLVGVTDE